MIRKKTFGSTTVKLTVILFLIVTLLLPILRLITNISFETFRKTVVEDPRFWPEVWHSVLISVVATTFTLIVSCALSWAVTRSGMNFKGLFAVLFTVPMLIPTYAHASGLIMLFGQNGILTKALHLDILFGRGAYIYGFWGIVIGSVMFSIPIATMMISDVMRYQDCTPYEVAEVMGIPKVNRFLAITVPFFRKPMISVAFVVFAQTITDYGVPHLIGGNYMTVAARMYQDTICLLDYDKGSVLSIVLLLPAAISFIMDIINKDSGNMAFVGKPFEIKKDIKTDIFAYLVTIVMSVFVLIPIFTAIYRSIVVSYPNDMAFTWEHYKTVLLKDGTRYLKNSLFISISVALMGGFSCFVAAYLSARMKSGLSKTLHLLTMTAMAVPGVVLGLGYVLFFKKTFIYNTFFILMLANMVHLIASPYLMMYNTFGKLNEKLEDVGTVMGISRFQIIRDVIFPMTKTTLWDSMSYFFLQSMKTITAVSLLSTATTKPLALKLNEYSGAMLDFEKVSVVALMIFVISAISKILVHLRQQFILRGRKREGNVVIPPEFLKKVCTY